MTAAQRGDWQARARLYFADCEEVEDEGENAEGTGKIERFPAFDWTKAVDGMLRVCCRAGLNIFEPVDGDARDIVARPHLSLMLDKGSDGFCGTWALLNKFKLRISPFFDPMHCPWRALDAFLLEQKLNTSMMLKTVAHNLEFGPFDGESWACQLRDTASEISAMADVGDVVLEFWWPRIAAELGCSDADEDETKARKQLCLKTLSRQPWLHRKACRVCSSRWGTFTNAEDERSAFAAQRSFVLMWQGFFLQGWLKKRYICQSHGRCGALQSC